MQRTLTDHGQILHWAGRHERFPVRAADGSVGFAGHDDEAEGRTPIGWQEFFPALAKARQAVLVDDEAATIEVK